MNNTQKATITIRDVEIQDFGHDKSRILLYTDRGRFYIANGYIDKLDVPENDTITVVYKKRRPWNKIVQILK